MTRAVQGTLMLAVGLVAARLVVTDAYLNYVKASMGIWLLVAAAVLVLVGLATVVSTFVGRARRHEPHDHPMTRAAWLLLLPALAVVVIPTDPLGSFAVDRRDFCQSDATADMSFAPLPRSDAPVEMGLREFVDRAFLDKKRSLADRSVRLTGFVTPALEGEGFTLSRFVILCCAADAYPVEIAARGADAPPVDSWVTVTGSWRPPEGEVRPYVDVVEFDVRALERIDRPENPYDPA